MKRLRSSRTQSLLLDRFLLRRRSQLSGGEFRALEAERHAQRLGIAERFVRCSGELVDLESSLCQLVAQQCDFLHIDALLFKLRRARRIPSLHGVLFVSECVGELGWGEFQCCAA